MQIPPRDMDTASGLEALAHRIIESYESRVGKVDAMIAQANETLLAFRGELYGMITQLKDNLAKSVCLRKRDFDSIMEEVLERLRQTETETRGCLLRFQEQEGEMLAHLMGIVSGKPSQGLACVKAIREDILKRQREREARVAVALRRFHIEQDELTASLGKLLAKGRDLRVRDLQVVASMLKARREARENGMERMLEELEVIRGQVADQWHAHGCERV